MDDQRREEAPSETAQAWDSARRVREPAAWALLALTAIGLLISAWELFGCPVLRLSPQGAVQTSEDARHQQAKQPEAVAVQTILLRPGARVPQGPSRVCDFPVGPRAYRGSDFDPTGVTNDLTPCTLPGHGPSRLHTGRDPGRAGRERRRRHCGATTTTWTPPSKKPATTAT
jgi:hypothetical protein